MRALGLKKWMSNREFDKIQHIFNQTLGEDSRLILVKGDRSGRSWHESSIGYNQYPVSEDANVFISRPSTEGVVHLSVFIKDHRIKT